MGAENSRNREVVALGAAAGEDYFRWAAGEQLRYMFAGTLDCGAGVLSETMDGGGVAELLTEVRLHRLKDLRQQRRGGVGVHVYAVHGSLYCRFLLVCVRQRRQKVMLMKFGCWTVAAVMAVTAASASAQMAGMKMDDKSMASDAAGKSFDDLLSLIEGEVVASAEAMPADKFDFAPSQAIFVPSQKVDFSNPKPVMTFAQEVKHLTMANYGFFATKDNKPTVDRKTISNLKTKDEIIAALRATDGRRRWRRRLRSGWRT
jgi:hypothetical protein